ncbi:MAG: hypothetical protein HYV24_02915 [Deltaproteobacteria bacterium]|nr:hypothetical protein [Deltaproteobacteria bacterium]
MGSSWKKGGVVIAGFLPVAAFFAVFFLYSVDVPFNDDFDAVLAFLLKYLSCDNLSDKLSLILSQHNEHRIAFVRLSALALYKATGAVDFRVLMLAGTLAIPATAVFLYSASKREFKGAVFLPAIFIIFQPQYYESIFCAMAALSNFHVILFALASFYFLSREGALSFALAVACAAVASYTQGNGIFLFPVGAAMLLLSRRYRPSLIWAAIGAAVIALYFHGYSKPVGHPEVASTLLHDPRAVIKYFLAFLGAPVYFYYAAGGASLLVFILLVIKGYYRKNPVVFFFLVFLFLTALAASVARAGFGVEQSFALRYRIVSVLIFASLYIGGMEMLGRERARKLLPAFLVLTAAFNVFSYLDMMNGIRMEARELSLSVVKWKASGAGLFYRDGEAAGAMVDEMMKKGIYSPDLLPRHIVSSPVEAGLPKESGEIKGSIDLAENSLPGYLFTGWATTGSAGKGAQTVYLVLKSDSKTLAFDSIRRKGPEKEGPLADTGFLSYIPKHEVPEGEYPVWLYVKGGGESAFKPTGLKLVARRE